MKKVPFKKIVVLVTLGLILFMSKGMAQVEKGVTSTGKEVDCSTIDPSVDKAVNEYGKGLLCILTKRRKLLCFSVR